MNPGVRFHVLTVEGGPSGHDIQAWLDGIPLKGLRRMDIDVSTDDLTTVTLELIVEIGDVRTKLAP